MKRKFYDSPPEAIVEEDLRDFKKEVNFIAKLLNISPSRVRISANHPCGEDVIFIDDEYNGYLDSPFYSYMNTGFDLCGEFTKWEESWRKK